MVRPIVFWSNGKKGADEKHSNSSVGFSIHKKAVAEKGAGFSFCKIPKSNSIRTNLDKLFLSEQFIPV